MCTEAQFTTLVEEEKKQQGMNKLWFTQRMKGYVTIKMIFIIIY